MPEDPTIKLTDFDCIVGDHHLQMLKAALPYLQVSQQRFLSFSIKFQELQHTMSLLHNEDNAALGICSLPERMDTVYVSDEELRERIHMDIAIEEE